MRGLPTSLFFILVCLLAIRSASAQLVISDPIEPNPIQPSKTVRQVSLNSPAGQVPSAALADYDFSHDFTGQSRTPVRVVVQYMMVDAETRASIYAQLDSDSIHRATGATPLMTSRELEEIDQPELATNQLTAPTRVTTCLLDEAEATDAIAFASDAIGSKVLRAPSVMLLEGKPAELNDIVQRPFVTELIEQGPTFKPVIEVLDDGNKIRLLASMPDGTSENSPVHLKVEFSASRILDVATDKIFGLQDEPLTVQVPTHKVTTAFTSIEIPAGKTLLLDPHVSVTSSVSSESSVPILGKIPYVGRNFKNTAVAEVEQHLIVLFKPSIEEAVR